MAAGRPVLVTQTSTQFSSDTHKNRHSWEMDTTLNTPDCIVQILASNLAVYFRQDCSWFSRLSPVEPHYKPNTVKLANSTSTVAIRNCLTETVDDLWSV